MSITITPYTEEWVEPVLEFNARLNSWGATKDFHLPPFPSGTWLPKFAHARVFNEIYLAVEGRVVRGAYFFKQEQFSFGGDVRWVACCHHPYSQGFVDRSYGLVGVQIYRHAQGQQPLLYGVSLNEPEQPISRLLASMGWSRCEWPFFFKVMNANRVLQSLPRFRSSWAGRAIATALSATNTGKLAITTLQFLQSLPHPGRRTSFEVVDEFDKWVDEVWSTCAPLYSVLPVRDCDTMRQLYPANKQPFGRLRVKRGALTVGWATVGTIQYRDSKYYGDLRVGAILDGLSKPDDAVDVVISATEFLRQQGVDLIVTNQTSSNWIKAVQKAGFLRARSRFWFAASKELADKMRPFESTLALSHITRSVGDSLYKYEVFDGD